MFGVSLYDSGEFAFLNNSHEVASFTLLFTLSPFFSLFTIEYNFERKNYSANSGDFLPVQEIDPKTWCMSSNIVATKVKGKK